jgi:hypothetical protein
MASQIDKDVDPVILHQTRDLSVVQPGDIAPIIGEAFQPFGNGIRSLNVGVTDHCKAVSIMGFQHRFHEESHRVGTEVRRDISDA